MKNLNFFGVSLLRSVLAMTTGLCSLWVTPNSWAAKNVSRFSVTPYEQVIVDDMILNVKKPSISKRGAHRDYDTIALWPGGNIPVQFDGRFTEDEIAKFFRETKIWESQGALIKIFPRSTEVPFLLVKKEGFSDAYGNVSNNCASYLGAPKVGEHSTMYLPGPWCLENIKLLVHEMGHALGFDHEHQRPDRDDFIFLDRNLMSPATYNGLSIQSGTIGRTTYDFQSIMHTPPEVGYNFTTAIFARPPYQEMQNLMGRGLAPSIADYQTLAQMYKSGFSLSFLVNDSFNGKVLEFAEVKLLSNDSFLTALTDIDGKAHFPGVIAGDYNIVVTKAGYKDTISPYYIGEGGEFGFALSPTAADQTTGNFAVIIKNESGVGLPNLLVSLSGSTAYTDGNGFANLGENQTYADPSTLFVKTPNGMRRLDFRSFGSNLIKVISTKDGLRLESCEGDGCAQL